MQQFPRAQEAHCEEKLFQNAITLKKFRDIVWQFRNPPSTKIFFRQIDLQYNSTLYLVKKLI